MDNFITPMLALAFITISMLMFAWALNTIIGYERRKGFWGRYSDFKREFSKRKWTLSESTPRYLMCQDFDYSWCNPSNVYLQFGEHNMLLNPIAWYRARRTIRRKVRELNPSKPKKEKPVNPWIEGRKEV